MPAGAAPRPTLRRRRAERRGSPSAPRVAATPRGSSGADAGSPDSSSPRSSLSRPWRSATTLCWWIVSRFSWRAETKLAPSSSAKLADHAGDHLAHAVLDEARAPVGLLDDLDLVRALHQLVDLRGHARLGDRQQRRSRRSRRRSPRCSPICSVARPRWLWVATGTRREDPLDLLLGEFLARAAAPRARAAMSSCAHGQAVMPVADDADGAPRAVLEGDGAAVQRVDLLRLHARHRRRLVLGVARRDRHLGARGALARAHELGDVLGERLGPERRLAQHDLADRLVDDLLEARHVRALLVAVEVDEAVEAREEQLVADAHDLLDAGDADAREPDGDAGRPCLDVVAGAEREPMRWARWPAPRASVARAAPLPGPRGRAAASREAPRPAD